MMVWVVEREPQVDERQHALAVGQELECHSLGMHRNWQLVWLKNENADTW